MRKLKLNHPYITESSRIKKIKSIQHCKKMVAPFNYIKINISKIKKTKNLFISLLLFVEENDSNKS